MGDFLCSVNYNNIKSKPFIFFNLMRYLAYARSDHVLQSFRPKR